MAETEWTTDSSSLVQGKLQLEILEHYQIVNGVGEASEDVVVEVDCDVVVGVPQTMHKESKFLVDELGLASSGDSLYQERVCLPVNLETELDLGYPFKRDVQHEEGEEEMDFGLKRLFSSKTMTNQLCIHCTPTTKPKMRDTLRPNHFFAIQISDSQILEAAGTLQKKIINAAPYLKPALVPLSSLHITLAVLHLATSEDIRKANEAMQEACRMFQLNSNIQYLNLKLKELGHFDNKVLYACLQNHDCSLEKLHKIVCILRERCLLSGIHLSDEDRFSPHMTLMKMSKARNLYRKGIRKIEPELYAKHLKYKFGNQVAGSLQLLSMNEPKDITGYYVKRGECFFEQRVEKGSVVIEGRDSAVLDDVIMEEKSDVVMEERDDITTSENYGSHPKQTASDMTAKLKEETRVKMQKLCYNLFQNVSNDAKVDGSQPMIDISNL